MEAHSTKSALLELAARNQRGEAGDRYAFLLARRQLVEAITGESAPLPAPPPGIPETDADITQPGGAGTTDTVTNPDRPAIDRPGTSADSAGGPAPRQKDDHRVRWLTVGVLLLLVVLYGAWHLLRPNAAPPAPALPIGLGVDDGTLAGEEDAMTSSLQRAAQTLLQGGWQTEAAETLLSRWTLASLAARKNASEQSWYLRLRELVEDQIDASMALQTAGGQVSATDQHTLTELAQLLEIETPEWEAEPARPDPNATLAASLPATSAPATAAGEPVPAGDQASASVDAVEASVPTVGTSPPAAAETKITTRASAEKKHAPATTVSATRPTRPVATQAATKTPAGTGPRFGSGCSARLVASRRPYCRDIIRGRLRGPRLAVLATGPDSVLAVSLREISFREFAYYCKATGTPCPENPWQDDDMPVVNVTWQQASNYAAWLSEQTGADYRLPEEKEWELLAAGDGGPYPFGKHLLVTQARFSTPGKTLDSPYSNAYRAINANANHLYHMAGNVREWLNTSDGNGHLAKGGSYADTLPALRIDARVTLPEGHSDRFTGFRVVRTFR